MAVDLNFEETEEVVENYEDDVAETYPDGYNDYSEEEFNDSDENYDFDEGYDRSKMDKLKKTAIVVGSSIMGLVLLSLILTFSVISKQSNQEKNIKDWVKDYIASEYSDELTDEQLDQIAAETGFLLSDALGAEDLDFTTLSDEQIKSIVEKVREPLISTLTDAEATELSEQLITKYYEKIAEEGGTIPGQTDTSTISDLMARINDLEYNDKQLKNSITTVSSQSGKQGAQGVQGPQGLRGERGETGQRGSDGKDGKNGIDGKDGTSATVSKTGSTTTIKAGNGTSVTVEDGTSSFTVYAKDESGTDASLEASEDRMYMTSVQAASADKALTAAKSKGGFIKFRDVAVSRTYDPDTNTVTFN